MVEYAFDNFTSKIPLHNKYEQLQTYVYLWTTGCGLKYQTIGFMTDFLSKLTI